MRAVVQRVLKASVKVNGEPISSIGKGLCVLVGISRDDTPKETEWMIRKLLNLKLFDDDSGKRWSNSVLDQNLEILCVSQFTLYCTLKGNKPDFHLAMGAEQSEAFYRDFLSQLQAAYKPERIKDGKFAAYMQVDIQNDGPVTIELEAPQQESRMKKGKGSSASLSSKNSSASLTSQTDINNTQQSEPGNS